MMVISTVERQKAFEIAVTLLRNSAGTTSRPVYRSSEFNLNLNLEGMCIVLYITSCDPKLRAWLEAEAVFWDKDKQPRITRNRISFTPSGVTRNEVTASGA